MAILCLSRHFSNHSFKTTRYIDNTMTHFLLSKVEHIIIPYCLKHQHFGWTIARRRCFNSSSISCARTHLWFKTSCQGLPSWPASSLHLLPFFFLTKTKLSQQWRKLYCARKMPTGSFCLCCPMLWCLKHDCSYLCELSNNANFKTSLLSSHQTTILHGRRTTQKHRTGRCMGTHTKTGTWLYL